MPVASRYCLYKDGLSGRDSATGLPGGMWYEVHSSPDTLEAGADGTIRTMLLPVFGAGQWAVPPTVQRNPLPTRVCS